MRGNSLKWKSYIQCQYTHRTGYQGLSPGAWLCEWAHEAQGKKKKKIHRAEKSGLIFVWYSVVKQAWKWVNILKSHCVWSMYDVSVFIVHWLSCCSSSLLCMGVCGLSGHLHKKIQINAFSKMPGKKCESEAHKCKRQREKRQREWWLLTTIPKLTGYKLHSSPEMETSENPTPTESPQLPVVRYLQVMS